MNFKYTLQFLILSAVILASCEKTQIQFGQAYVDNSYSNLILVDTLSAELSTLHKDSVVTSASGSILAGEYNDNVFGKITAKSFFEVIPPALTDLASNTIFDSLVLIIRPDKSYYGDTAVAGQLSVHQLTNQLNFPLYQTQFYSTTDFAVDPVALGSINTFILPGKADSIFIRLSDTKGQELFDLYKSRDYVMQTTASFLNYFKGLQLSAVTGSMQAVYGFNDSVIMRLHYHETNLTTEKKFIDFNFYNDDGKQFNQVKADRTGTPTAIFSGADKEVASAASNNKAYLQSLTGLNIKIKFPTLRSLLQRTDFLKILKAELIFQPAKNSYGPGTPLPPVLTAYSTDASNTLGTPLTLASATGSTTQTGNLVLDPLFNENTTYDYDVTSYLQQQILISAGNQNGLLLSPPSPASIATLNRLIIGDQKNTAGSIKLKLYYVSVSQ